jgi:fructose-1,6-bisphosphatase/inositol monophosphatase family enzyme
MMMFTAHLKQEANMADDKMKSEDAVPQADKQAHTEIAEREGREGEQARVINKEEAKKRKDS